MLLTRMWIGVHLSSILTKTREVVWLLSPVRDNCMYDERWGSSSILYVPVIAVQIEMLLEYIQTQYEITFLPNTALVIWPQILNEQWFDIWTEEDAWKRHVRNAPINLWKLKIAYDIIPDVINGLPEARSYSVESFGSRAMLTQARMLAVAIMTLL